MTTEDTAVVTLSTRTGVLGNVVVSQVSGGRRNRLWFELDGSRGSAAFDQEEPETAWLGTPQEVSVLARGNGTESADAARFAYLPGGHAQGYQDCFNSFVVDTYVAIDGSNPDGLPTFEDGLRSAHLVEAVVQSGKTGRWTPIATTSVEDRLESAFGNHL